MPTLHWPGKRAPQPQAAALETESLVFPQGAGYPAASPMGQLIWGDNLKALWALLPEWEGRLKLIYADPPFFTNKHYPARIGQGEDSRKPQEWRLAKGYADDWHDLDAYLEMLYPRLALMYRLLAQDGSLYLHLDWHADAYARLVLDEIFGPERLLNEIIWTYHGPSPIRTAFNRKHDTILAYTKSDSYIFNVDAVRQPYDPVTVKTFASSAKAGFGKVPNLARGKVPEDWWYFPVVARLHGERTGYPTQKPEALLERILLASSNPGDWVADFFCGSGTTPVVAQRLERRFIACDAARGAVQTTRARLVGQEKGSFTLQRVTAPGDTASTALAGQVLGPGVAQREGQKVILVDEILPELAYWEVDPDWNGCEFHSVAQAVRPRKLQPILRSLELPAGAPSGQLCLRLVTAGGDEYYALQAG